MNAEYLNHSCYVDTNVFIYLFDYTAGRKNIIAREIYKSLIQSELGFISILVVSEWRNVMIRKYKTLIDDDTRLEFLELFEIWSPALISLKTIIKAEELSKRYCLSPFDSLHIQSALDQNCKFFLSEDMQDGLLINDQLTIVNPFKQQCP